MKRANCAEELAALRARRERLDALLPLVAQGAEPPAEFRARVLAAAEAASEAKRGRRWRPNWPPPKSWRNGEHQATYCWKLQGRRFCGQRRDSASLGMELSFETLFMLLLLKRS